jgi:hypothetical protein
MPLQQWYRAASPFAPPLLNYDLFIETFEGADAPIGFTFPDQGGNYWNNPLDPPTNWPRQESGWMKQSSGSPLVQGKAYSRILDPAPFSTSPEWFVQFSSFINAGIPVDAGGSVSRYVALWGDLLEGTETTLAYVEFVNAGSSFPNPTLAANMGVQWLVEGGGGLRAVALPSTATGEHTFRIELGGGEARLYADDALIDSTTCTADLGDYTTHDVEASVFHWAGDTTVNITEVRVGVRDLTEPAAPPAPPPLVSEDGLVFQLDMSNTGTYPGTGQTVSNLVPLPADGAAQADYHWTRGQSAAVDSTDTDYVADGAASYMSSGLFGLGRYMSLLTGSTSFLKSMHKDGAAWTIIMWVRYANAGSNIAPLFDSGTSDGGGADMSRGVIFGDTGNIQQTVGRFRLRVKQDSGGTNAFAVQSDAALSPGSTYMLAASLDEAAGTGFLYRNGDYDPVSGSGTFAVSFTSPSTTDATNPPRLGARGDAGASVVIDTRWYVVRVYNRALTKAELDTQFASERSRFGV